MLHQHLPGTLRWSASLRDQSDSSDDITVMDKKDTWQHDATCWCVCYLVDPSSVSLAFDSVNPRAAIMQAMHLECQGDAHLSDD